MMDPGYPHVHPALLPPTTPSRAPTMGRPAVPQDTVAKDTVPRTTAEQCNAPGRPLPQIARPDLVGPFDGSAHAVGEFNFSPRGAVFGRISTKVDAITAKNAAKVSFKIKARRVKNRNAKYDTVRDASTLIEGLTHQSAMEAFQLASRMVPIHRSPHKKAMLDTSTDEESNAIPEFEEFPEDLDLDLWDAKGTWLSSLPPNASH